MKETTQPEEWESRFDNAFAHNYLIADEDIIEDVHNRIKSFIKTEIRKAEDRTVEGILNLQYTAVNKEAEYCISVETIKKYLEALKK